MFEWMTDLKDMIFMKDDYPTEEAYKKAYDDFIRREDIYCVGQESQLEVVTICTGVLVKYQNIEREGEVSNGL